MYKTTFSIKQQLETIIALRNILLTSKQSEKREVPTIMPVKTAPSKTV